jgi:hypothetical protein
VAAEVDGGEGVPVRDWRREVGVQLHGVTAKLARGLWSSGKGYNSGSTVSCSRRRWRWGAAGFLAGDGVRLALL